MQSLYGAIANTKQKEIMVNVDTVYQRVLAIANKEQRGYITPLEFNLLANQVQLETFEDYFVQINQATTLPGNDTVYADILTVLEEKLQIFENVDGAAAVSTYATVGASTTNIILPDYIYRIDLLTINNIQAERLNTKDYKRVFYQPLTEPTLSRPIYYVRENVLRMNDGEKINPNDKNVGIFYIKKPAKVEWGYVVTNEQALYNASSSDNFELHASEETMLVEKILGLAGIIMQKPDLAGIGQQQE